LDREVPKWRGRNLGDPANFFINAEPKILGYVLLILHPQEWILGVTNESDSFTRRIEAAKGAVY
jgi:hypothetical protein